MQARRSSAVSQPASGPNVEKVSVRPIRQRNTLYQTKKTGSGGLAFFMQSVSSMSQTQEASTDGGDYEAGQVGPWMRAPSTSSDQDLDPLKVCA